MPAQYPWDLGHLDIEAVTLNASAASSISFNACALPGSFEFPRTATRDSLGTISFRSSSCLPLISGAKRRQAGNVSARLRKAGDKPRANRIIILRHDNGDCDSCFLGGAGYCRTSRDDDVHLKAHQLGCERRQTIEFSLRRSILNDDVFPLHVAELAQTLPERSMRRCVSGRRGATRNPIREIFVGCCASTGTSKAARSMEHRARKMIFLVIDVRPDFPII